MAALLEPGDWKARPISPLFNVDAVDEGRPAPLLRKHFSISSAVTRARLYVSSLGAHETWINDQRVGDALLDPGWTAYQRRLLYAAYDVTDLIGEGDNVLSATIGDGWWRGNLTWMERRAIYGGTTALLAQLEIECTDGSRAIVSSDESWRGAVGEIVSADIYNGCVRDLRREPVGWRKAGFDDRSWDRVTALPLPEGLELRAASPVRVVQTIPAKVECVAPNLYRVDAGQNLAGHVAIHARGQCGSRIDVRHAEVLDAEGALFVAALRHAKATDSYVLASDALTELAPSFTFHGFRYAEIACDPDVKLEHIKIAVQSSDLEQIGSFACSDERLNRLYQNVRWSQLSNFLALPTDCPQRDERLGWTGDIQVFAPTACANADALAFLTSWLKDLAIEQRDDGCVPSTVPNVIQGHEFEYAGVGWGDAATLVPWALYVAYGDVQILRDQFASMQAWVNYGIARLSTEKVWVGDFHLGDWLDPGAPADQPEKGTTERDYIASCYLSYSARIVARAASIVERPDLAAHYERIANDVAAATWRRWRDHALTTQAGCALAIAFDIAPSEQHRAVADALAVLVERGGGRIATGFLGTPLVLPALTRGGRSDAAYRLLLNEECPGWLYQVKQGATTMWERWDAIRADGQIHAGELAATNASMTSFNHYAYGAVGRWLYETVAGIAPCPDQPGFANVRFAPCPGGGLKWAKASIRTPYGLSSIEWALKPDGALELILDVAPGADGFVVAPRGWSAPPEAQRFGSGRHVFTLVRS